MGRYQIAELMGGCHWIITEVGGVAAYNGKTYTDRGQAQADLDRLVSHGQAEDKPLELTLELEGVA